MIPIFDGHNDTLLELDNNPDGNFFRQKRSGHIDFPKALEGDSLAVFAILPSSV
jgi:hypothetical protein